MLLIAVDEAGYGPKLGPLVIAATAWQMPDRLNGSLSDCFEPLRTVSKYGALNLVIDDSKKIFQSKGRRSLQSLAAIAKLCSIWCGCDFDTVGQWLRVIAADDYQTIIQTDWFRSLEQQSLDERSSPDMRSTASDVIATWRSSGAVLREVNTRILTASVFNRVIRKGQNKSDLLSDVSLQLIASVAAQYPNEKKIEVFCDRHGGRRYYGAALQHQFATSLLRVISETKQKSEYDLASDSQSIRIRFTVKGDSFTPVALSSLHAKYLRELCMGALNHYFQEHAMPGATIKPTAGYPVDAERFLSDVADIIKQEKIDRQALVRCR